MKSHNLGAAFVNRLSAEVLQSEAVNHPYLRVLAQGELPNVELAFKDFAFQYAFYSAGFVDYVSAVIDNLSDEKHRKILRANLAEEQGHAHDIELPADVLASVDGLPHSQLFTRFQQALGIDDEYRQTTYQCPTVLLWGRQFLQLCQLNECVGVGAVGIGTELIVSGIYKQILQGLKAHSSLTAQQRVFFDLHSECDDEHAAQMQLIAADLAQNPAACEQIEYGARMAINLRTLFWDKMLDRALNFPDSTTYTLENLTDIGYQKSL